MVEKNLGWFHSVVRLQGKEDTRAVKWIEMVD